MADNNTSEEKILPPTPHKLRLLRKKGSVPTSPETTSIAAMCAVVLFLLLSAKWLFDLWAQSVTAIGSSVNLPLSEALHNGGAVTIHSATLIIALVLIFASLSSIIIGMLVTGGLVFSMEAIKLDFSRLNPVEGLKNIFKMRRLVTLMRGLIILSIICVGAFLFVTLGLSAMMWSPICGWQCTLKVAAFNIIGFLIFAIAVLFVFGVMDLPIQNWLFKRDQKMSRTEFKREQKEQFGSPEIRRAIKQSRNEVSEMKKTNPKDVSFIIAGYGRVLGVKYIKDANQTPIVVAKLRAPETFDYVQYAFENNIKVVPAPIYIDAVFAHAKVGYNIPPQYFDATAQLMVANDLI